PSAAVLFVYRGRGSTDCFRAGCVVCLTVRWSVSSKVARGGEVFLLALRPVVRVARTEASPVFLACLGLAPSFSSAHWRPLHRAPHVCGGFDPASRLFQGEG